jgi:L-threonylcarbamoyladenylate synthase
MAWQIIDLSEKPVTIVYENPKNLPEELLAEDGSVGIRIVKTITAKKISNLTNLSFQHQPISADKSRR